ncbi:MAG TPA: response regulator, partial [Verrucomicrobiota bacterium]|nr:response regulator [Verrucomicrobiota bacterium]
APKAAEKKLALASSVEDSIPKTRVSDVTRLRQIIVNLIDNAVKFTTTGEVVIEVTSASHGPRATQSGQTPDTDFLRHPEQWLLHFSVRDTGIGIPVEKQHRLFKSFQQVDASTTRHYGGTGLGLAICKRLVELLGGKIWVESQAGKGATFHFTILTKASAATAPPNWQLPQPQLSGKRLLLIEDNAANRQVIKHRAEQWGLHVAEATTGNQALSSVAKEQPFDAIILDLQLPDVDGFDLAAEIRKLPAGNAAPLLFMSSARLRSDDTRPAELGVSVMVHKPVRPAQLLDVLCRAMSVQLQREKKSAPVPALDTTLAQRLPLRILLADDNPINQKVGVSVLHKLGYRADVAQNGIEVIQALEHKPYDILFLDVQMPEMDGLECARKISARWTRDKRPVIIAMTGNALMGDREKCLGAGMDDYVAKPVRVSELQTALERWGPTKSRSHESTHFHRKALASAGLLDESMLAELREMSPGDGKNMLHELIDLYLDTAPDRIQQIIQHSNDPAKLGFHAHALKSISLNLGCKKVVELAQKLEDMANAGNVAQSPPLITDLEKVFKQTMIQLAAVREQESGKSGDTSPQAAQ